MKPVLVEDPAVVRMGQLHDTTPAQIALSWGIQRGSTVVIPKSENPERMRQQCLQAEDLRLSAIRYLSRVSSLEALSAAAAVSDEARPRPGELGVLNSCRLFVCSRCSDSAVPQPLPREGGVEQCRAGGINV